MSSFNKPSLFATTTEQALSPTTFSAVTIISIGLLIARINVYAINAGSLAYPIPDRIVNKTTAPAPGAAGVPTLATNANTAIVKIDNNVTLYYELNTPILCLSQLSRRPEKREDKRPNLTDWAEQIAFDK